MAVESPERLVVDGEHVVQFYDDDADLIRAVGGYLSLAVSTGEAAILIASEPHRRAFAAELAASGIDVGRALEDGSFVSLDAAETMSRFIHAGRIDPEAFRETIGGVVRAAQQGGRRVRAYGEMVALLWDAGDVLGAIELEKLWNELGGELHFALWCGYHIDSAAGEDHADALHQVCHLHTAVIHDASARFLAGPDAPLAARRFVTGLVARRPYAGRVDGKNVQLVVSELATNAVMHARTPFSISVSATDSVLRISVHDWSSMRPIMRDGSPAALSGRGLRIVATVSRDWGVDFRLDGKTVWAELPFLA